MTNNEIIVVAIAVVAVIAILAAVVVFQRRRTGKLRSQFGPEYARTIEAVGARGKAEAELHQREARVAAYSIQSLTPADRDRYLADWNRIQTQFIDAPVGAVAQADELVGGVMTARGYPMSDFEQRAADLSVDHPIVVENYRAAHAIAVRHERGEASTEELRKAMIHYRALVDDLVGQPAATDAAVQPKALASQV